MADKMSTERPQSQALSSAHFETRKNSQIFHCLVFFFLKKDSSQIASSNSAIDSLGSGSSHQPGPGPDVLGFC